MGNSLNTKEDQAHRYLISDAWSAQGGFVDSQLCDSVSAKPGQTILDLGCGSGEVGLELARRLHWDLTVVGIDKDPVSLEVAQQRAVVSESFQASYQMCVDDECLVFANGTFDSVVSRFGLMLFKTPYMGMREMRRVLKPGGRIAVTVWSNPEGVPTLYWSYLACENRVPHNMRPPLPKVTCLGGPGVLEHMLKRAGFSEIRYSSYTCHYRFRDFNEYWAIICGSEMLRSQVAILPETVAKRVKEEIHRQAQCYTRDDGSLSIPHEYLLATGRAG